VPLKPFLEVKENVTLTLLFFLPPFDTPTWYYRLAWQRKRNTDGFLLTWFMFVFLQRVAFIISYLKMQVNLRGKNRSHFLIAIINPATSEGERTDETTRFPFLLPTDPSSFFRPQDHRHCCVSYRAVYPKLCMFSHPLLVWNIVGGFCMSASFMFNNCLIIVSSCAFYGYWWFSQCVVFFMFKKPRILVWFLVFGLDLCVVVDYVYVHPLCLVCYACMQNICLLLCFGFLVSMFSSITYANGILITERSLRDGFSVRSFIMWYIFFEIIEQTTYLN